MKAPTSPPADAGQRARDDDLGQQLGRPRQRHPDVRPAPFGRGAERAGEQAADGAEDEQAAPLEQQRRGELDEHRLGQVERDVREALVPDAGDHQRDEPAHEQEERDRAERGARPAPDAGGDEADARGERDQQRLEEEVELRHAEVELGLERRQADQEAAGQRGAAQPQPALGPRAGGARAGALGEQHALADERQRGAADQHQVGRAPQRHVLAEQAVPDVVEREADQREAAAGRHQHAAERRVPAVVEPDRGRAGLLLRDHHREEAGGEDAEQAEQDQVVRRVGERAGVAAVVDVQRDVPVHAEQRRDERGGADGGGERDPGGEAADAAGERRGAVQELRLAGAVAEAEREQQRGGERGAGRGEDDLCDRRAPGGIALGEESCHRPMYHRMT